MLAEIHNEIANMSCGCMGYDYTPERVEKEDKYKDDYNDPKCEMNKKGRTYPIWKLSNKPRDYIGNIIRKYIEINKEEK